MTDLIIKPRGKQVLVVPDEQQENKTENGIFLPSTVEEEEKTTGTIVAVGPDVSKDLEVGHKILYGAYAGDKIKLSNKPDIKFDYVMVEDEDIIAHVDQF